MGERWGRQRGFDPYGGVAQLFGGGDGLLLAAATTPAAVADDGEHARHHSTGAVSTDRRRAPGWGRRTTRPWTMPGRVMSWTNWLGGFGRKVDVWQGADDGMGGGRLRVDGVVIRRRGARR